MHKVPDKEGSILDFLQPESTLEYRIILDAEFRQGLFWGKPRYGHPEGQVIYHIRDVLNNIDKCEVPDDFRKPLRLIALIHDTFKYKEPRKEPRDWTKHHAVFAKQFAQRYIHNKTILNLIEWHDEAYYAWREIHVEKNVAHGKAKLTALLKNLGDSLQLYYLFFKCDTRTGDKNQTPLIWFERNIQHISIVDF